MKFWAFRQGNAIWPANAEDAGELAKLTIGKPIFIEAKQPRNGAFHRLYWTMCTRIANAIGAEPENVSDVLKLETGHYSIVKTAKETYKLPRSISYAAMDQAAFSAFFERCLQVIYTQWGIKRPDMLAQLEDLLTPTDKRDAA